TLAHYYTYLDVPGIRFRLPGAVQLPGEPAPTNVARFGNEIQAIERFPRVPISGASLTFPIPSWYSVVRSEAAYFQGEPMNRQGRGSTADSTGTPGSAAARRLRQENNTEGGLDPFLYPGFLDLTRRGPVQGSVLQRDTFNFAAGLDVNRFVRWLNPSQTILLTTQFFYKHVFDSPGDLVLPVSFRQAPVDKTLPVIGNGCGPPSARRACRLEPRLFHLDDNRFLHTLLVTTSYYGGRIVPSYGMFYDWQGAFVFQPGVADGTPSRPWRSKPDLARTLFRTSAAALADAVRRAAETETTARAKLAAALHALFRAARHETFLYELLILPPSPDTQDFVADADSPARVLAGILSEGQQQHEFGGIDPRLAAECIMGAVNRVTIYRRLGMLPG